jgi:hypothetical protein
LSELDAGNMQGSGEVEKDGETGKGIIKVFRFAVVDLLALFSSTRRLT